MWIEFFRYHIINDKIVGYPRKLNACFLSHDFICTICSWWKEFHWISTRQGNRLGRRKEACEDITQRALNVVFHRSLPTLNWTVIHCSSQVLLLHGSRQSFPHYSYIAPNREEGRVNNTVSLSASTMNHRLVLLSLAILILEQVRGSR